MTDKAYVGIELGDLELRVVYIVGSEALNLPLSVEISGPQILFDPYSDTSSIGVGFPTVLQKLGTPMTFTHLSLKMAQEMSTSKVEQRIETPESMITQGLAAVNEQVLKITGKPIGAVVIAVPAMMRQSNRQALLDCARDAGFNEVSLIDRCTAAAIGYHNNIDKSTTAVVYDLGYGNCEYALLRLVGERCRVMASGAMPEVSGEALDALAIEAIVLALRKEKIYLGLKHFTPLQWYELRHIVGNARNTIAEKNEAFVTLIPKLTGLDKTITFRFESEPFRIKLVPLINKTIDAVHGIVEQNALELADIDSIIVVGSSARQSPVFDILHEAFEQKAIRTAPELIANGAAWHASHLATNSVARVDAEPGKQIAQLNNGLGDTKYSPPLPEDDSEAEAGFMKLVTIEDDFKEPNTLKQGPTLVITTDLSLEIVRRLIELGRHEEAAEMLDFMSKQVETLKARLQQEQKIGVARMRVQQAASLVEPGYELMRAVDLTHRAYEEAPDDPEVFEGMLKVHAQAGLRMLKPEEYELSVQILMCALSHDQTNHSIRQALAERHYKQALVMHGSNRSAEAFKIVDKALIFDAKHPGLNQLHEELAARLSGPESVEETAAPDEKL